MTLNPKRFLVEAISDTCLNYAHFKDSPLTQVVSAKTGTIFQCLNCAGHSHKPNACLFCKHRTTNMLKMILTINPRTIFPNRGLKC